MWLYYMIGFVIGTISCYNICLKEVDASNIVVPVAKGALYGLLCIPLWPMAILAIYRDLKKSQEVETKTLDYFSVYINGRVAMARAVASSDKSELKKLEIMEKIHGFRARAAEAMACSIKKK